MAEVEVDKLDESNDSIKLNGVPSDTNLIFEKENESRLDDEQGSCVSRKRLNSNEISNVDKLADSSSASSITDKSTNALANGHLTIEPATSECDSGAAGRVSPAAVDAAQTTCRTASGKDARPTDEDKSVISNGEESNSDSSSIVDSASQSELNCSAEQSRIFESIGMGAMPLDFAHKEIARTNSGLSITMVSTPKPSDEQNSRWDRGGTNDELRKTDSVRSDASGGGGHHHRSSEVSIKDVVDTVSAGNTPDKQHKKYNKKSLPALNITPRRSTRNINKLRSYNDKDGDIYEDGSLDGVQIRKSTNDDDDIEEITPTDPLADDSGRSKMRNKTIVVSDTKGLVEFATNARISSKCNKKEPTLVIIDTKSILSGRGPVPVSQSPGGGGGGGGGGTSMLHPIGSSTPIPVSLPISGSPLNNTPRGLSVSSSAFSVIPIGLPTQNLYPQFRNPPPQMKPIIVGPASTTVTPVSVQQQSSAPSSSSHNIGGSSSSASVTAVSVPAPPTKQPTIVLPSLTDDMFVVEAPSFIVPYVYEKPPMKALKEYIEKIETVIKEAEEKEAEEKSRLEALEKERVEAQEKERVEAQEKERIETQEKEKSSEAEEEHDEAEETKQDKEGNSDKKKEEEDGSIAEQSESASSAVGKAAEAGKGDEEKSEKSEDLGTKKEDEDEKSATEKPDAMEVCSEEPERVSSTSGAASNEVTSDKGKPTAESGAAEVGKKDAQETAATKDDSKKSTSVVDDSKKPPSFFDNPLGKFFIQIGLNLVQEHVQTDLLRSQKRKRDKEGENCSPEVHATISELTRTLESSKENNDPFKLDTKKCELCSFRTESLLVMAHHLETPHMKNYTYRCNFCPLEVRSPHDILFHMEAEHNVRGRLERAPAFHQCANCPFEDNQKGKLTRHMVSCLKKYRSEKNQEPPLDWEPPAKIPRVTRNRPPSMSPGNAVYQAAMSGLKQVPQNTLLPKLMPNATNVKQNMMAANKRPSTVNAGFVGRFPNANTQPNFQQRPISIQNSNQGIMYRTSLTNSQTPVMLPQNYQFSTSTATLYQSPSVKQSQQGLTAAKLMNQPSISITPLPRQSSSSQQGSSSSNAVMNSTSQGGKGSKSATTASAGSSNSKNSFVVCEICDGYIKDLEQLRNHMQWIHKVKIHPKMIYNRPPLNCQKCQFRFFTDQGLERHLLGSHGLVTSSMQEAANKGKDGGRCPVCGRVYQWKLLNHVARDHQMALKPAHLSYKCTVCTATFGMYKQFESHVYSAHSVVAKRAMDPKKPPMSSQNDALLKPLKINDEITIIPQPVRQTKPMNKMIVNTRSKDGDDDKFCARKCTSLDFSTVEEFERHLLTKHARPFRIQVTRVDAKLPDRCAAAAATAIEPQELSDAAAAAASVLSRQSGSCELPPAVLRKQQQYELKPLQIRLPKLSYLREHRTYKVQLRDAKRNNDDDDDKEAGCILADSFLQASMKVDESRSIEVASDDSSNIPFVYNVASGPKATPTDAGSTLLAQAQASAAYQSIGAMADFFSFGNHFLTNGDVRPAQSNSATSRPSQYVPIAAVRKQPSEGSCLDGGKSSSSVSRAVSFSTAYATDATKTHPALAFSTSRTAPPSSSSSSVRRAAGGIVRRTMPAKGLIAASPSFVFRSRGSSTFFPVSVTGNPGGGNTVRILRGRVPFRMQSPRLLASVSSPIAASGAAARIRIPKKTPPPSPADDVIVLTSSDSDDVDDGV